MKGCVITFAPAYPTLRHLGNIILFREYIYTEKRSLGPMPHPIVDAIISGDITDEAALQKAKKDFASTQGLSSLPSNADILSTCTPEERCLVEDFLRMKPTRTLSGVAVVAVMTSPHDCPHGRCSYCPGGTTIGTAQSYTGHEPAAMRASQNDFDPYEQTLNRILALEEIGHHTDKVDLIIMGGTFTSRDKEYKEWFVKRCLDAMNGCSSESLSEAQDINSSAPHRCVGLTVETRPDIFTEDDMDESTLLGATRVELGVQTVYDNILEGVKRGHGVLETKNSTKLAKDRGLKICYHMMPGLPGSTPEMDFDAFKEIYSSEDFKPDMVKIYPTLVVEGTELYESWAKGDYNPLETKDAADLVSRIKEITPSWVRIQRVQRDIPSKLVTAGVKHSNLRQIAAGVLEGQGKKCMCIRCREIGRNKYDGTAEMKRNIITYNASGGIEAFISLEIDSWLVGFARLRKPSPESPFSGSALLRELKVFGPEALIGEPGEWQHRGWGKHLVELAEEQGRKWGMELLRVTTGVGVREYYSKMGYDLVGMGMEKKL